MALTPQELTSWIAFAQSAISLGVHTVQAIAQYFHHHDLTPAEEDQILQAVADDALRRAVRRRREASQPDDGA